MFDLVDPKKDAFPIVLEEVCSFGRENSLLQGINFQFINEMNPEIKTQLDINRVNKLYLVMKEAINNAIKHSQAATIITHLTHIGRDLQVQIKDDGIGFELDLNCLTKGSGISNLIAYSREGFMDINIQSTLGQGTCVYITVPYL
ncbi:MAG: hypothetical protein HC892_01350 [Saprospiraceae bacterium]|nr:hypothetical protein [Saprospiraceae bacterium]